MTIVKWVASTSWGSTPTRKEYVRETECFYIAASNWRDSKVSRYEQYFDTEAEATQFIAERDANRKRNKEINQIKSVAVELLEAAERYLAFRHTGDIGMGYEYSGIHPETQLKAVIAKAKGEA